MNEKHNAVGATEPRNPHANHHDHGGVFGPGSATVSDPVCGMWVDAGRARFRADEGGRTYYFCGSKCREKFVAEPSRYIAVKPAPPAQPQPAGTIYTCPMHPQIRQVGPGTCPICGMALEPEVATAAKLVRAPNSST